MNPYVIGAVLLAFIGWTTEAVHIGKKLCESSHLEAQAEARVRTDATATVTENQLAASREGRSQIRTEVNAYAATPAAHHDCLSDDGLRQWRRIVSVPGEPDARPAEGAAERSPGG